MHDVQVSVVIAAIDAIGTVTYSAESKAKINAASIAYKGLTEAGKALVTNYETLKAAQEAYDALKAQAGDPEQPKQVYSVEMTSITLQCKKSATLTPTIVGEDGAVKSITYTSSNDKVVRIDGDRMTGLKKGTAIVTCTVIDETGTEFIADCTVTVNYTWWQWIIVIVLFGWLWY